MTSSTSIRIALVSWQSEESARPYYQSFIQLHYSYNKCRIILYGVLCMYSVLLSCDIKTVPGSEGPRLAFWVIEAEALIGPCAPSA